MADRVSLAELAEVAGVDRDDAYRLLRLGRAQGHPETTSCDARRVDVVTVLARLEALLPTVCPPPDRILLELARKLHAGAGDSAGMPRALVAPIAMLRGSAQLPPAALTTRANVGPLMAGYAGIVVDLGSRSGLDWSPAPKGRRHQ